MTEDKTDKSKRPVTKKDLLAAAGVLSWIIAAGYFSHTGRKTISFIIVVIGIAYGVACLVRIPQNEKTILTDKLLGKESNVSGKILSVLYIGQTILIIILLLSILFDWLN